MDLLDLDKDCLGEIISWITNFTDLDSLMKTSKKLKRLVSIYTKKILSYYYHITNPARLISFPKLEVIKVPILIQKPEDLLLLPKTIKSLVVVNNNIFNDLNCLDLAIKLFGDVEISILRKTGYQLNLILSYSNDTLVYTNDECTNCLCAQEICKAKKVITTVLPIYPSEDIEDFTIIIGDKTFIVLPPMLPFIMLKAFRTIPSTSTPYSLSTYNCIGFGNSFIDNLPQCQGKIEDLDIFLPLSGLERIIRDGYFPNLRKISLIAFSSRDLLQIYNYLTANKDIVPPYIRIYAPNYIFHNIINKWRIEGLIIIPEYLPSWEKSPLRNS